MMRPERILLVYSSYKGLSVNHRDVTICFQALVRPKHPLIALQHNHPIREHKVQLPTMEKLKVRIFGICSQ